MTITRTFTRDELEAMDLPRYRANVVSDTYVGEKRWGTTWELVFRTHADGPLWQVTYYKPATEAQECDTWGYHDRAETVEAIQVEPYEVTVTKYRPVTHPAASGLRSQRG